ncbi:MAG: hypothetical protein ABI356_08605 [Steroidobacteraceae bacterium]
MSLDVLLIAIIIIGIGLSGAKNGIPVHVWIASAPAQLQLSRTLRFLAPNSLPGPDHRVT